MIRVAIRVAPDGCLAAIESRGHASTESGRSGENLACAAVSSLLRSVGRLLAARQGVELDGDASRPGFFTLYIIRVGRRNRRYVQGVTDVLLQGLSDIREDYPEEIEIREIAKGEQSNGT